MKSLLASWDRFEEKACAILLGLSASLAFYEVLSRYFLHTSIDWSSEIVLYAMAWCTMLGACMLVRENGHVGVSVIFSLLKKERHEVVHFFNSLICLVFAVIVTWSGVLQVHGAAAKGMVSESSLQLPLWIPYLAMPLGGILLSARIFQRLFRISTRIRPARLVKDPIVLAYIFFSLSLWLLMHKGFSPAFILAFGLLTLLALGVPVAFALGFVSFAVLFFFDLVPIAGVAPKMFESVTRFAYLAIPFFILSGTFMTRGGIARPLLNFADEVLKGVRGGFAISVMAACLIFSSLSGASAAIAAALGIMAVPAMTEKGYPKRFSLGILSAGGTLGVLIPPSTILILYGAISGESVADLFKAGIAPGLVIGAALCLLVYAICKFRRYGEPGPGERFSPRKLAASIREAFWAILMPFIILGGIYSGIFTPTEAAAVSVFYAAIICSLTYQKLRPAAIFKVLEESARLNSMIYFIIMGSTLFSFLVTLEQFSGRILDLVISMEVSTWLFLLITNLAVFLMGCFLSPGAILLMVVPILHPVIKELGIDPVHFGVLLTINMELAFITPPFGMNLFVLSSVCDEPILEVVKGHIPFLILLLAALLVITYLPWLSLVFL